ncbi:unnamed protein product [Caenorhabditis sp. 36 PRJEB53466]|nr:unnamed protein product [Caenorhabditis sp. 36 PRJEB53466]
MRTEMVKDKTRNRLMDCYIRGASTYAIIVKLKHFSSSDCPSTSDDLVPLVVYSMNKKKRWEIGADSIEFTALEDDKLKVILFERELKELFYTWCSLEYNHFENSYYNSRALDGNLMEKAKKEEKVLGYHVIRVPKHFKKVFDKKCVRYIGLRYPDFLGYDTSDNLTPLEYELRENGEFDEQEDDKEEFEGFEETKADIVPPKYYKLEDHVVSKRPRRLRGWQMV